MTDATHAVTQSALEAFTREYLTGLGASIREEGNRWQVRLPAHVDVAFVDERAFEVLLDSEATTDDGGPRLLTPESEFTQQVLDEAAEMAPVGQVAVTDGTIPAKYRFPSWITDSSAVVEEATFTPYYDKAAVCVFVRVGVETVSEYQTQFLEAIAVDTESKTRLEGLEDLLVREYYAPTQRPKTETGPSEDLAVATGKLDEVVTAGQTLAAEELQERIDEVRESASRAADSEFEEYRQLQEQRLTELQNESKTLADRIQKLAAEIHGTPTQQERVEALEKRRELKVEKETLENELSELLQEKESGYNEKYSEIYERHAIEVRTKPLAVTLMTYERGEIEMTLREGGQQATLRAPYAIGVGITDSVRCDACEGLFSVENPIRVTQGSVVCDSCL